MGYLSDRIDRRLVVVMASFATVALSFLLFHQDKQSTLFIITFGLLGAMVLPIYSLGVAHTNDRLRTDQMSNASSTIVLLYGIGAAIGPISVGYIINIFGNSAYIIYLGGINLVTGLLVSYWIYQREAVPEDQQGEYQLVPSRPTTVAMGAIALEAEDTMNSEDDE
jgi:predicted MFS family arabinose efflux permease